MPYTIPGTSRPPAVTENRPPAHPDIPTPDDPAPPAVTENHPAEPPATAAPGGPSQPDSGRASGERPRAAVRGDDRTEADQQAPDSREGSSTGRREPSGRGEERRSGLSRINANTVIGALIGVIGMIIVAVLTAGVVVMNSKFADINARFDDVNARFDDMFVYFDGRFNEMDKRLDDMNDRLTAVENDIKSLRQDLNDTNARLDVLIALLEANSVIPADVVPKSTSSLLPP